MIVTSLLPPSLPPSLSPPPPLQAFITKPKYCVPFLQPGRLVCVEHGDEENFGWGTVVNFQKKANQKVSVYETLTLSIMS